jgi:DNA-binding beta-propeller fold protein YncE
LDQDSDFYVANQGDNTIVRMKQGGSVMAIRRVTINDDPLENVSLNGIATSPDGGTIYVTFIGPDDEQGGVLAIPAFSRDSERR